MKNSDQQELWRAAFSDEGMEALRSETLASGLAAVRARKRRKAASTAAASLAAAVAAVLLLRHESAPAPAVVAPVAVVANPTIRFVDDQQLFALFPDKTVALIGEPGQQRLVLVDDSAK